MKLQDIRCVLVMIVVMSAAGCGSDAELCGNGRLDAGESCDLGKMFNNGAYGGCNADCTFASRCGDGVQDAVEACDLGAMFNTGEYGGCNSNCTLAGFCGDGIVNGGEGCDLGIMGNTGGYGGCNPNCTLSAYCGDGIINGSEICDLGKALNVGTYNGCNSDCTKAGYCGDGVINGNEACDMGSLGNTGVYGGCNPDCTLASYCGDGIKDSEEACDLGESLNTGLYGGCKSDCTLASYCGDGIKDSEEACDLGESLNTGLYGGCKSDCTLASYCGDGIKDSEEACDLGESLNTGLYGGCKSDCTLAPYCGDGIKDNEEACDLGESLNTGLYGGCKSDCTLGPYCGDGIKDSGEACDLGESGNDGLACTVQCTLPDDRPENVKVIVQNVPEACVTNEAGSKQMTFEVVLDSKPSADVDITIRSSNDKEGRVEPGIIRFTSENYSKPQIVTVIGSDDSVRDGDVIYFVQFDVSSPDDRYDGYELSDISVLNEDDEEGELESVKIRFMSGNLTTGNYGNYDNGEGIRIFKALKPDIIMIQEFLYTKGIGELVRTAFGDGYYYYQGACYLESGCKPNGIISRYPIKPGMTGSIMSPQYEDRAWDWAVIDIPGERDLLVLSLHLHSKQEQAKNYEMDELVEEIETLQKSGNYYLAFGGDFNTTGREKTMEAMSGIAVVDEEKYPRDQKGNGATNAKRENYYDYVLFNEELNAMEVPVVIGDKEYPNGHVFDTRLYTEEELEKLGEVKVTDSGAEQMQHMGVIRDIRLIVTE